jgi:O-antigen ligase
MSLDIKLKNNRITLIILFVFSSVFFTGPVRSMIPEKIFGDYITSFGFFLYLITLLTLPVSPLLFLKKRSYLNIYIYVSCFLFVIIQLTIDLFNGDNMSSYPYLITIICPIYIANLINVIIIKKESYLFMKGIVTFFILYLLVNIIYYALFLAPKLNISSGLSYPRMGGTLAPTVLLGYIIMFLFPVFIYIFEKEILRGNYKYWISIFLIIIASFLTGSRGSLWFVLLTLSIFLIKNIKRPKFIIILSIIILLLLSYIFKADINYERFTNTDDHSRTSSWSAGITYWNNSDVQEKVFGYGLGTIYPYQSWIKQGSVSWDNSFFLGDKISVIHPHNSYIWILVEGGIIGLLFLIIPFILSFKSLISIKNNTLMSFYLILTLIFLLLSGSLGSGLMHTPSFSILWWVVLLSIKDITKRGNNCE